MNEILGLLDSKKRCLRRFLEITRELFASAERGDLSQLPAFELKRDAVIKTLTLFDNKITETVRRLPAEDRNAALASAVQAKLDDEALLVQAILQVDNLIFERIETEKSRLLREAAAARKSQELTGRFKSGWMPESGEELDHKA